jgi:Ala-tRNA(Pro) deacylase
MPEEREEKVFQALASLGILFSKREHPPVATVEEAVRCWEGIPGAHCKNLFVRNKKGNHHYLIIAEHRRPVDLRSLAKDLRDDRLSFASNERLERLLGLHPGEVSPFGLLQDGGREVVVVLDEGLREAPFVSFHPNVNTATVTIAFADLMKFLEWRGNRVIFVRF